MKHVILSVAVWAVFGLRFKSLMSWFGLSFIVMSPLPIAALFLCIWSVMSILVLA